MKNMVNFGFAAACAALTGAAQAQVTPAQEYAKFVERSRAVTPMTEFGDQINPRDGSVTVRATDIELKGTGPTIRITRSYNPNVPNELHQETSGNNFGYWELEIPRVKTITANIPDAAIGPGSPRGWQVSGKSDLRCTNFSAPSRISFPYDAARGWNPGEWWDGYYVVDDGGNSQPLMSRGSSSVNPGYTLITLNNWLVDCLPATTSGEPGEGFHAVAPDGTQYWFSHLVYTAADTLQKPLWTTAPSRSGGAVTKAAESSRDGPVPQIIDEVDQLERRYASMLVTRIQDRFGNWVTYHYTNGRVDSIDASDGRHVSVTTDLSTGRITAITAGSGTSARTWTYSNAGSSDGFAVLTVTRPDQSAWHYNLPILTASGLDAIADAGGCTVASNDYDYFISGSITSPAGATLDIRFNRKRFARSYVYKQCWGGTPGFPDTGYAINPREWYAFALDRRTVNGPGLPSMVWNYSYSAPVSSWYGDCATPTSCVGTAWAEIQDPLGNRHRSIFSTKFDETENKLQREEWYSSTGQLLRATDHAYATVGAGITASPYPWPLWVGDPKRTRVNTLAQGRWAPERQTVTAQDGVNFTRTVTAFDAYARATAVTRGGPGGSLNETTSYWDNTTLWVMSQVDQVVSGGLVAVDNDYDSNALLVSTANFGIPQASYTWYGDGTVHTQTDGAGAAHTTTYANWYRGLPQSVSYPTGKSKSAVVDERGWVTSVTDEANYTTTYGYDAMGRLASITPPAGFTDTSLAFEPVEGTEYGLGAGHWRQTVTQGNAKTITYFDAMWRPVMTRSFDTSDEASTRKVVVKQYDHDGRTTYNSYPARDIAAHTDTPGGVHTAYDGLGRETQKVASSELGPLTTSTAYLTGFLTQVTNPRGKVTTQSYWALDDLTKALISTISAPAGVTVSISRDAFGKPIAITRGGTFNGFTSNVTRSYVYDAGQRLCKTIEPELGATVQTYDAAGNVDWKAPGQPLTGTGACDQGSVGSAAKMVYGYDALNRLTSVTYGDGSPSVSRTYTPDGLPETVTSNGSTWTYGYNALRKLGTESLAYASKTYDFGYGYNSQGNLSTLTYPDGSTVSYSPNALGEARGVSGYASSVSYHPNGAVAGYALANGIAHSLTQNARGLPLVNRDGTVLQDQYGYDENGNITAITDLRASPTDGAFSRTMAYDDLDRLASASAPGTWGNASYTYDPVDNLRTATVGTRSSAFNFNATSNQLTSVVTNGSTAIYGFDPRGNLTNKGAQTFAFDLGNRLSASSQGGGYVYDGLGRRIKIVSTDGTTRIQVYSQQGQLLWAEATSATPLPANAVDTCISPAVLIGGQCVITNSYDATPAAYTCPNGGTLSGSTCTRIDSSTYGATVTGYTCNSGDSLSGSTCTHNTPSTYAATPTGYSCLSGGSVSGSTCTRIDSSTYGATLTGYACNSGDSLSGSTCTHNTPSTYAATPVYSCNSGDSLSGTTCTHTVVTAATPNYSCPAGYALSGTTCTNTVAATPSYSCAPGSNAVLGSNPAGINGNACLQEVVATNSSDAQQQCLADGVGMSFIKVQFKSGKVYTCIFQPIVSYACPGGGTVSGSQCVATQTASIGSYSCSAGAVSGSQCVSTSNYTASVSGYTCSSGDSLSDSTCTHYAASTYGGTALYSCSSGDSLSGSTCTHVDTVTYGATVTGYSCNSGDSLSGSTCTQNTFSTYGGTPVYGCTSGDSLSGSTCTHTNTVTYGATFGGYTCNGNDSLFGSTCTHTTSTAPTTTYNCNSIGGTLNGQQCVGALRKTGYIYLGGKQIAESNSASGTQYVHTDALGSPVAHTGPTGAPINRSRFEPYGYVAAGTKPSANTSVIGFTGHVQDAETDLVYMQQRYYDPIAGRFLSVDPVVTDANSGKMFGRYTYVENNPYAKVDPDGRESVGEMIDRNATEAAAAGNGGATFGWAFAGVAWKAFGAEGISQIFDKGFSGTSGGDKLSAGLEIAAVIPGGKLLGEAGAAAKGTLEGGTTLFRRGANDTTKLLATSAEAAQKSSIGIHGVSVSTDATAKAGQAVRSATVSEVQAAGFKVTQTGSNPAHHTVELPNPVTKEIARIWNDLFK